MIIRPTARLLAFDPDGRALLFRCRQANRPGSFWILPDGGVEPDETCEQAAVRELLEETGIEASGTVGRCVLTRDTIGRHADFGERDIVYRFFPVQLIAGEIAHLDEDLIAREGYEGYRWWSLVDLDSTRSSIWPEDLAALARGLLPASGRPGC